jgi:hypothetical protein
MNEFRATFHFIENALDSDTNRAKAARENAARSAVAEMTYVSTGVTQQRVKTALTFPVIFRTAPHLTTGSSVVANPKPNIWHDPVGHVGVWKWDRDARGFYTGAFIWWRVEAYPISPILDDELYEVPDPVPPNMRVQHFLSFSGVAFKDLPTRSLDPALRSRIAGFRF